MRPIFKHTLCSAPILAWSLTASPVSAEPASEGAEDLPAEGASNAPPPESPVPNAPSAYPPEAPVTPVESESEAYPSESEPETPSEDEFEGDFDEEELEYGATAEVTAPPREPTKHSLEAEELTRIPGTRGDALRAIEVLPGVARTGFGEQDGPPALRGSSSIDSKVLLDGSEVPLLYHFGGLTSFYNSHLLERVDLYPGNFSARYGRASGGIVEARVRDPRTDGFHGMLELSLIDDFVLLESPLGDSTAVAVAARRSNIDFVFESMVPEGTYNVVAAPVYWDYQAIAAHRFNERHKLRLLLFGSQDRLKLVFDDPATDDPALRGDIEGLLSFHRAQLEFQSEFSDQVHQNLMVSVGPRTLEQHLGEMDGRIDSIDAFARAEWSVFASSKVRVDTGLDLAATFLNGTYHGSAPPQEEGNPELMDPLAAEKFLDVDGQFNTVRPAAYAEVSYRPAEEVLLIPGVRADYYGVADTWSVDPRLALRIQSDTDTTWKAGAGVFSQPPLDYELIEELGNPDLEPFRTYQLSAGVERHVGATVEVDVEGFYKRWDDRIVGTDGGAPPRFVNDGSGRAYGFELLGTARPAPRTTAFLSYTLSRSERRDRNEPWRLFDQDQTHNLSIAGNYDLGSGWLVGARFRFVTGNPYTPVLGAVYDASSDTFRGIYGDVNSARRPAFQQLDVRAEKRWSVGPGALTAYLEVLNVYNAQNVEGRDFSFDYSRTEDVTGIPIFPNLGIRGEL